MRNTPRWTTRGHQGWLEAKVPRNFGRNVDLNLDVRDINKMRKKRSRRRRSLSTWVKRQTKNRERDLLVEDERH